MGLFSRKNSNKSAGAMVLRGFPADSDTNKCLLMAAEQGVHLNTQLVDTTEGACDGPEYRGLSPFGKVPCLKDGAFVTSGGPAVLAYLGVKGKGAALNPKKASILGEQNYWVQLAQGIGDPAVHTLMQSLVPGCEQATEEAIASAEDSLGTVADQLAATLDDGREYIVGDYSFADVHWTAIVHLALMAGQAELTASRPGLQAWYQRVTERASSADRKPTYPLLVSLDEVRNKQLKFAA